MRFFLGLALCAWGLCAQTADDPEVIRAKAQIEKMRELVAAGALPRQQLERAEDQMADAQDAAFLRKTIYGTDLTADEAEAMIAAAGRRLDRREKAFDQAKKLVDSGVASELSLSTSMDELRMAKKEYDLAESRAALVRQLAEMARLEEAMESRAAPHGELPGPDAPALAERYDGDGVLAPGEFDRIDRAFEQHFGKPLPVSAMGETAVHRALGFDHRGRVDVAIYPDTPEGIWLRDYLKERRIPFFAFRAAVPGKATGAHIHIGPESTRLKLGG
jgi:hypothetical protein